MRILVLHAWLKGNLGDVLQLSVLLSALRRRNPSALDLAGYPARPAPAAQPVLQLADRFLADPFPRAWAVAPRPLGSWLVEPRWRRRRAALFSRYDAIVCAPGPYLADYDPRSISALVDIDVAANLGMPVVLSSHSIGPLRSAALDSVGRATLRVARERTTHEYLAARGIPAVLSADLAFLYPYGQVSTPPVPPPYRVLFLRSNNLSLRDLRLDNGAVYAGSRLVADGHGAPLVLATSDQRRDGRFLARLSRALAMPVHACHSVDEMVALIGGSEGVISDRYHPAICAAVLGRPARVLENREPHKMTGLQDLLTGHTTEQLQALAGDGLRAIERTLWPS